MNIIKEISKLNDLIGSVRRKKSELNLVCGNYNQEIVSILKKVCPYSKVGLISFSKTYQNMGKELVKTISLAGCKTVSLIMPEKYSDSIDYAGLLFNLPEDVRCIITLDRELCHVATYFSGVREVPVIYFAREGLIYKSLDDVVFFKNGGSTEKIDCGSQKYVVIDPNFIKENELSHIFAHIVSKTVALFDYKIYKSLIGEKVNKSILSNLLDTISDTIKIMDVPITERWQKLMLNCIKIEILNYLSCGELFSYSAEVYSGKLLSGKSDFYSIELASAIKILAYYSDFFGCTEAFPVFPNYNLRAETVANVTKISEKNLLDSFIMHTDRFFKSKEKYFNVINSLKQDAEKAFDVAVKLKSTYLTLGGKESFGISEELLFEGIRFSGDVPFFFNGMTILRELGILE